MDTKTIQVNKDYIIGLIRYRDDLKTKLDKALLDKTVNINWDSEIISCLMCCARIIGYTNNLEFIIKNNKK